MDINDRLYVTIEPFDGDRVPQPQPVRDGHFDEDFAYKVLGMYNPSETSECYFVLSNTERQIWLIPQRHLRALGLLDSDELFLEKTVAIAMLRRSRAASHLPLPGQRLSPSI